MFFFTSIFTSNVCCMLCVFSADILPCRSKTRLNSLKIYFVDWLKRKLWVTNAKILWSFVIVVSVDSSRKKEKNYRSFCSRHVSCLYSKKANKDFFKMIRRNPGGTLNMMQLANHAWVLREAYYFSINTLVQSWVNVMINTTYRGPNWPVHILLMFYKICVPLSIPHRTSCM